MLSERVMSYFHPLDPARLLHLECNVQDHVLAKVLLFREGLEGRQQDGLGLVGLLLGQVGGRYLVVGNALL